MKEYCNKILTFGIILFSVTVALAQDTNVTNTIGMEFVLIKPGTFVMGKFQPPYPKTADTGNKANAENGYTTAHYTLAKRMAEQDAQSGFTVTINRPFYIGKFEVTQAQWKQVMANNPSTFQGSNNSNETANHPVENVSWSDVQQFLKKLNALEQRKHYRLPTEAEWEYAARAGAEEDIPWAQIRTLAQIDTRTTNPVGGKTPNAWGLYDMLGNVWEWVHDYYNEKLFADPTPPKSGKQHVLKGASFTGDVKNATYMSHAAGPGNGWDVGFRVVLDVNE